MKSRPLPACEKSVFINCPFDSNYRDLMLAIVFSVAAHGFVPRSAQETEGDAEPRFSRILTTISESKYSIRDLSRSTGESGDNLARFNMLCDTSHNILYRGSLVPGSTRMNERS